MKALLARGKLLAWGRARQAVHGRPALYLFTDRRMPNPLAAIAALPAGRAGVVFRHDHLAPADRARLLAAVRRLCRAKRLALSVAGSTHWRAGRRGRGRATTVAVHGMRDIPRRRGRGAVAFVSPVFPTRSHAGARPLGVVRATVLARAVRRAGLIPFALGGVSGRNCRALPAPWAGLAAIDALGLGDCGHVATEFPDRHDQHVRVIAGSPEAPP